MALPLVAPEKRTVKVAGEDVEIRGLTRAEAMGLTGHADDVAKLEPQMVAFATGTPLDEVQAWYAEVASAAVQPLVNAIMELSGLNAEVGNG